MTPDMPIGLTPRALDAMVNAGREAARLGHAVVGPEHVLLGLLREGTGLGAGLLTARGVDLEALGRALVAATVPALEGGPPGRFGSLSPEAREALSGALREAQQLRHNYIGQEHLLLALLARPGTVTAVLAGFQVTYEGIRGDVLRTLGPGPAPAPEAVRRYNLALPESMFQEVEALAAREHMTVLAVIRRSIKLGLLAAEIKGTPGASLVIVREGSPERELVIL